MNIAECFIAVQAFNLLYWSEIKRKNIKFYKIIIEKFNNEIDCINIFLISLFFLSVYNTYDILSLN